MNMKNVKQKILRFLGIVIIVCGVVSGSVEEGEGWGPTTHNHIAYRVASPIHLDFNYVITPGWLGIWSYVSGSVMADVAHLLPGYSTYMHDTGHAHPVCILDVQISF
jgi:hypothetical protein